MPSYPKRHVLYVPGVGPIVGRHCDAIFNAGAQQVAQLEFQETDSDDERQRILAKRVREYPSQALFIVAHSAGCDASLTLLHDAVAAKKVRGALWLVPDVRDMSAATMFCKRFRCHILFSAQERRSLELVSACLNCTVLDDGHRLDSRQSIDVIGASLGLLCMG